MNQSDNKIFFAVDRGGTFTDVFAVHRTRIYTEKLLSEDPANYADAPGEGIRRIIERISGRPIPEGEIPTDLIGHIRMGTTVATNALLERNGEPCCLVITKGFGDLLQIGHQNRPELFKLNIRKPKPLHHLVLEVEERVRPVGPGDHAEQLEIVTGTGGDRFVLACKPDPHRVRKQLQEVYDRGIRSLAIVLMHGHNYRDHEILIGGIARSLGFTHVSLSHEVMPRIRIVGRGDTTCVDAYLTPHISRYLQGFRRGFHPSISRIPIQFMQSDGGLVNGERFTGSNAILSGPAGGVCGYAAVTYELLGKKPVIGFDMGGTSTDVSRFAGRYELIHETETAGIRVQAPQIEIRTVAAGGGSRLFYRNSMFEVGPQSAGAHPGPVCYRKNGHLAVTDANLFLGRLQPDYFPAIFGPGEDQAPGHEQTRQAFLALSEEINRDLAATGKQVLSPEEISLGFLDVANEVMVRPIREISVMRGYNIQDHVLACFGGAGGQHGCAVAAKLGISMVFIHRYSGILSAVGMALADVSLERREPAGGQLLETVRSEMLTRLDILEQECRRDLLDQGFGPEQVLTEKFLNLRYRGTDNSHMIKELGDDDFQRSFREKHLQLYGFDLEGRELLVDDIRVRATGQAGLPINIDKNGPFRTDPEEITSCYFKGGWRDTPIYLLEHLQEQRKINGPALIIQDGATVVIEPGCTAEIVNTGIIIHVRAPDEQKINSTACDPIQLAVFSNQFMSIAEQMGRILQKTAISTNIKERLDFSCAIFDDRGGLVANAPHVPVHLGAMSQAVKSQIELRGMDLAPGEVIASNHPAMGGSHLPDITIITPVRKNGAICFFVACRGHHSDIGSISPGSMPPFSKSLDEEGLHLKSFIIMKDEKFQEDELRRRMSDISPPVRHPDSVISDLKAQIAANRQGVEMLLELMELHGDKGVQAYMGHLQDNAESAVRSMLRSIGEKFGRDGKKTQLIAEDFLDDASPIRLRVEIDPEQGTAVFDFSGTGAELPGNLNAPIAVTRSAILYALRCLIDQDIPLNQGCLNPIRLILPPGSLLNPSENAAVAGGNVLTSQRIVDVIFKAFQAVAASQGCMNNLTFGNDRFGYYETICGGSGAGPDFHGCSGVHTHMTNTRITDPEILEQRYPVMLRQFSLRPGSGGKGCFHGGDGVIREMEFLDDLHLAVLSERRTYHPYGMHDGEPGRCGQNLLITKEGGCIDLGGKNETTARRGDAIRLLTPGGGGWGKKEKK